MTSRAADTPSPACACVRASRAGLELFAGQVRRGDPDVEASAYGTLNYWSNSFDTFGSALVTQFELMVVNNWCVCVCVCVWS